MDGENQIDGLHRLTRRHIAKVLSALEGVGTAQIVKDSVKKHFYFLEKDIAEQVLKVSKKNV